MQTQPDANPRHNRMADGGVPPLTPGLRARIRTIDLDNPPPFVRVGDFRLAHEIAHLPTPGISHWLLRHDWGAAAGIFNRGLTPSFDALQSQHIAAVLQNENGSINRVPALEERDLLRLQLRSDLTDTFLDNAVKLCGRVLRQSGYATAVLGMRFHHPDFVDSTDANFHVDPQDFRLFFVLEHRSLRIADERAALRAGFKFNADDLVKGVDVYPANLLDAGVAVYDSGVGVPIIMRGTQLANLGPRSWHASYEMPENSKIVRANLQCRFFAQAAAVMSDQMHISPRRIRGTSGLPPELTPAQRAKIVTINLDDPPAFVQVLHHLSEARTIVDASQPSIEAWVYRPDWGAASAVFDRRQALAPVRRSMTVYNSDGGRADEVRPLVVDSLGSPQADLFLDNICAICKTVAQATGSQSVYTGIDFEPRPVPGDVHIDVMELRMFTALEHGNVVLPDIADARAKGFVFSANTDGTKDAWELVDLIEAGVPVYSAAFGDLTFMRGHLPPGRPTWHAAYPMNPALACQRPTIKADFTFG